MSERKITTERRGHLLLIGLARPAKLNAFDVEMLEQLGEAFGELERDPEVRCGVIFANGPHFTAGLDLANVAPAMMTGKLALGAGAARSVGCSRTAAHEADGDRRARSMSHARHRALPRPGHHRRLRQHEVRADRDQARHLPVRRRDVSARADGGLGQRDAVVTHRRRIRRSRGASHRARSGDRARRGRSSSARSRSPRRSLPRRRSAFRRRCARHDDR